MSEKKILIVDDALYMRAMLRDVLTKQGYLVVAEAENGKEAIAQVESHDADLMTVDLIMPKVDHIDGIQAIKKIRELKPNLKILVVSALAEKESFLNEIEKMKVDGFIIKPFEKEDFLNKVNEILSHEKN